MLKLKWQETPYPPPYYLSDDIQYYHYPQAEGLVIEDARKPSSGDTFATQNQLGRQSLEEESSPSRDKQLHLVESNSSRSRGGSAGTKVKVDNLNRAFRQNSFGGEKFGYPPTTDQERFQKHQLGYQGDKEKESLLRARQEILQKREQLVWSDDGLRQNLSDHMVDELGSVAEGRGPGNSGDQYTRIFENPFIEAIGERATSTFSIDVDKASYTNVRQFLLQSNRLPPPDAVRIEELINYFDYEYAGPESENDAPFSAHVEVAGCPWQSDHRLVRIGIKGREMQTDKRPFSNLVFLVDVSGSMNQPKKLPLVVEGLQALTRQLGENDRVAIVVYASSEGLVLDSTPGTEQQTILEALGQLQAGGSTAGGAGIRLAYQIAEDHFIEGGVNRVILCTDGDFNVGTTSTGELQRLVEQKAKGTGVFLSVLGFGRGNLNDAMMEVISNHGNGNYHYVDNQREARRVLVEELTGTLVTIAKDVKIQVFFNPAQVAGYRLLGYENRMLKAQDFNDDTKDAGEIGAGHTVTALYEIIPAGQSLSTPAVEQSPYIKPNQAAKDADSDLLTLRMRYKQPDGDKSSLLEWPITDEGTTFGAATGEFKFATAVAGFGMLLRDLQHKGNATWDAMQEIASEGIGEDPAGRRNEFLSLVGKAKELAGE